MEYTIQVKGRLVSLREPQVMGILNCTPDSFFAGSRVQTEESIARRANQIIEEGGTMIDVGGFSTRPGGVEVPEEEEMRRLRFALPIVRREQPEAILSVDTYRPNVARMVVEEMGADIINDVSEGGITGVVDTPLEQTTDEYPAIFRTVAALGVPYILMSVKPTIHDMLLAMAREVQQLRDLGQKDIILDPGFGFGKTQEQNYDMLREMNRLSTLGLPHPRWHESQADDIPAAGHQSRRQPQRYDRCQYAGPDERRLHPPRPRRQGGSGGGTPLRLLPG